MADAAASDSTAASVKLIEPSYENNIYMMIPHALKPVLPDPVFRAATCHQKIFGYLILVSAAQLAP